METLERLDEKKTEKLKSLVGEYIRASRAIDEATEAFRLIRPVYDTDDKEARLKSDNLWMALADMQFIVVKQYWKLRESIVRQLPEKLTWYVIDGFERKKIRRNILNNIEIADFEKWEEQ